MAKSLRFASLIRVSTEQQEKTGESLRTQRIDNEESVAFHKGNIVERYGGQEHATPGFEKREVDRLLRDAQAGRFDAVIVANADRWSRDNSKSQSGLDILAENNVRFFVGTTEYDLVNPEHCLFLGMSAVIGKFQAQHQKRKSMVNRIERAKRGLPVCGKLPFGRTFVNGKWGLDPEKQAMVKDVAKRYLAGEPMPVLAAEYGINHSNLHKIMTRRCGTNWEQSFNSKDLKISETITTEVPELLPEATVKAILERSDKNKTFRGKRVYDYLLGGYVYCETCGYMLNGQTNHNGLRYYRHNSREKARACTCRPKAWVRADELEKAAVALIYEVYGNPIALRRAIDRATPNATKIKELRERGKRIEEELEKVAAGRDRVVGLVASGKLTDAQVDDQLAKLQSKEESLRKELATINAQLADKPTPAQLEDLSTRVTTVFRQRVDAMPRILMRASQEPENATKEDVRDLLRELFTGKQADGSPSGIYIGPAPGQEGRKRKQWQFRLRGKTLDEVGSVAKSPSP